MTCTIKQEPPEDLQTADFSKDWPRFVSELAARICQMDDGSREQVARALKELAVLAGKIARRGVRGRRTIASFSQEDRRHRLRQLAVSTQFRATVPNLHRKIFHILNCSADLRARLSVMLINVLASDRVSIAHGEADAPISVSKTLYSFCAHRELTFLSKRRSGFCTHIEKGVRIFSWTRK